MDGGIVFLFLAALCYVFIQFARQEHIQDDYEDVIVDVEGRLEWARTRSLSPFGMKAQIDVAGELLATAKSLWDEHKWQQAYRVVLQAQEAMNMAQQIYSRAIASHRLLDNTAEQS